MKVAVNTRLLVSDKLDGIGYYAYEILQRWVSNYPEVSFYFLFDRPYSEEFIFGSNVTPVVILPEARHPFLYYIWFHIQLPIWLNKNKPDVFFSPEGYLAPKATLPQVNVIHDLNFEHNPKDLPFWERWYYKKFFPKYAQIASQTITVSEFSKQDIIANYNIPPHRITTIYNGIRTDFKQNLNHRQFAIHYCGGMPFILHVGTLHPRKNIPYVIEAFNIIRSTHKRTLKLVFVGRKKWWTREMQRAVNKSRYKKDIVFTDRIDTSDLSCAYTEAICLVMASAFEGFGLPVVEAMACGCPVVSVSNTALTEVIGEAGITVSETDPEEMAEGVIEMWLHEGDRKYWLSKGLAHSKKFSWDAAADKTWNTLCQQIPKD